MLRFCHLLKRPTGSRVDGLSTAAHGGKRHTRILTERTGVIRAVSTMSIPTEAEAPAKQCADAMRMPLVLLAVPREKIARVHASSRTIG
jgi:hypothetical protein